MQSTIGKLRIRIPSFSPSRRTHLMSKIFDRSKNFTESWCQRCSPTHTHACHQADLPHERHLMARLGRAPERLSLEVNPQYMEVRSYTTMTSSWITLSTTHSCKLQQIRAWFRVTQPLFVSWTIMRMWWYARHRNFPHCKSYKLDSQLNCDVRKLVYGKSEGLCQFTCPSDFRPKLWRGIFNKSTSYIHQ